MKWLALALALFVAAGAHAQEAPKKKPVAKKQQAVGKPAAHAKPTPEQIRRFNELQKKKQQ